MRSCEARCLGPLRGGWSTFPPFPSPPPPPHPSPLSPPLPPLPFPSQAAASQNVMTSRTKPKPSTFQTSSRPLVLTGDWLAAVSAIAVSVCLLRRGVLNHSASVCCQTGLPHEAGMVEFLVSHRALVELIKQRCQSESHRTTSNVKSSEELSV